MLGSGPLFLLANLIVQVPSDLKAPEVQAFLDACNQALVTSECRVAQKGEEAQARIERVTATHFLLELAVQLEKNEQLISREFTFQPEDDGVEQARALGLSLGLLARSSRPSPTPAEPENRSAQQKRKAGVDGSLPSAPALAPEQAQRTSSRRSSSAQPISSVPKQRKATSADFFAELQFGAHFDPELNAALGTGVLRALYGVHENVRLSAGLTLAGTRKTLAGQQFRLVYTTPLIGVRAQLPAAPWGIGLSAEAGARNVSVSNATAGSRGALWIPHVRIGVPVAFRFSKHAYLLATADLNIDPAVTEIYLDQQLVAASAMMTLGATLGFGLRY